VREEGDRLLLFCVLDRLQARDIDLLAALSQVSRMNIQLNPRRLANQPI